MAKAQLKTTVNDNDVYSFLHSIADEAARKDCLALVEMMRSLTQQEPKMWGAGIVGFGNYTYTYESGRSGDWFYLGFSPRKQNLTLYMMCGFERYPALLEQLGKHKCGKGCLYIKKLSDIDQPTLQTLLEQGYTDMTSTKGRG